MPKRIVLAHRTLQERGLVCLNWRAGYAAHQFQNGVTVAELQQQLGVTRQRVYQMILKGGARGKRPTQQDLDAAIDQVRTTGKQQRGDIIQIATRALKQGRYRVTSALVRKRVTERWGRALFIPPAWVPDFHMYCSTCGKWVAPSRYGTTMCRTCAASRARERHAIARTGWTDKETFRAAYLARKAAQRQEILEALAQEGVEATAARFGLTVGTVKRNAQRARAERREAEGATPCK